MNSVRVKLPLPSSGASTSPKKQESGDSCPLSSSDKYIKECDADGPPVTVKESQTEEEVETVLSKEVLFVLSQLFCHVQHVQV